LLARCTFSVPALATARGVPHILRMCGRITQKSNPNQLGLKIVNLIEPLWADNTPPRYNGAPGQEHWVIRQNPKTGERTLDRLWWGLIPYWNKDEKGGRKPINAKGETVATLPTFRDAYKKRRCILPIDNFFEWKAIKGVKAKQPYAIAMKSGEPFGLAAIWENWQRPGTEEWVRTFAVITCPANELMADIHDRMPVIVPPESYDLWLSSVEPDPRDLLVPFPSERMKIWPISTRVNKVTNDDLDLLAPSV
jgi:putative SOS response-associated peptidase YedK